MKKNLISAVAAGLALALAITSFGCESGNDTPVHLAYTRDRYGYDPAAAADAGDVFTYIAKPTNVYINNVTYKDVPATGAVYAFLDGTDDCKYTGYTTTIPGGNTYVNGVQSYNVCKGTFDTEGKDPDYTLEAGKVVNTWTETISFDPATGTFEYYDEKTEFNVIEYVFCTNTAWGDDDSGEEGKAGKAHIVKTDANYSLDDLVDDASSPDELILYKAMRDGMKYKVYKKDTYKGVKVFETTQYVNADGDILYEETTTDIDPTDPLFHYSPKAVGTFKITGNFKVGTILITSWDDGSAWLVFDDEKGTYVELESDPTTWDRLEYQNFTNGKDIEKDFPEESTTSHKEGYVDLASKFCKTGRTLEIADLVVKTKKIKTDTTNAENTYNFTSLLLTQDPKFIANGNYLFNAKSCNYILQD